MPTTFFANQRSIFSECCQLKLIDYHWWSQSELNPTTLVRIPHLVPPGVLAEDVVRHVGLVPQGALQHRPVEGYQFTLRVKIFTHLVPTQQLFNNL